ncbi:DUF7660 family protein [Cellulophaga baltica]|uniref:DUF7660 family protein n=1 Tax=Cellulophaga baltica TaxID=76594 RepID=UPI0015F46901|nr:hypothetical protein [Cellulophaga baltica]MBA6316950.1 hypothetical protein [Cellulophaga baltica]
MKVDLNELLDNVNSKETFFEFLDALKRDKEDEDAKENENPSSPYSSGVNGWENGSIAAFLDAMHAFGQDSDKIRLDWRSFALLLYAGKFYE